MMDWIDEPLRRILAIEELPGWLVSGLPGLWAMIKLVLALVLTWFVSRLVGRGLRALGRRRMGPGESFEGSSWDLGASLVRFFLLVLAAPLILALAGLDVGPFLNAHALGVVTAFAIVAAGIVAARWIATSIRSFGKRARQNNRADDTLFNFVAAMTRYGVVTLAVILALQQLGFPAGSLIAVVGAAGLAIALALQDTLRAVAAGVLLAVFRPFRLGDWVAIAGTEGEVADMTPFHTTLIPVDHRAVIIPNDKAWSDPITNFSREPMRRLDLYFDISYEDDTRRAMEVVREALASLPETRRKEDIWVGVHALNAWSVTLRARPWTDRTGIPERKSACILAVKTAFENSGVTIPYPRQVEYQLEYPHARTRETS